MKDKPIWSPIWVVRPSRYASAATFPFRAALAWWAVIQVLAWLEPVPPELDIQFHWQYLALQHVCAILAQFLLPLVFVPFLPRLPEGRVRTLCRVSIGAGFWYLWTFPLAFLFTGVRGTVFLELARPVLWAGTLAWTAASLGREGVGRRWFLAIGGIFWLVLGDVSFQLIPDSAQLLHFRMDNMGSGRICTGVPVLSPGDNPRADWCVWGDPKNVSSERLSLGERQKVVEARPGFVHLQVAEGFAPPPSDTSRLLDTSASDGDPLRELVARVPSGPDSARLLLLHTLVHGSIRYQRTYFPGTPGEILARGAGDCKAYAQVFCAAARRLGYPARVVHGLLASADGYYAHAWTTVRVGGRWMDWDATSSMPFPDARYLRFSPPREASGVFNGELAIFALDSVRVRAVAGGAP